MTPKAAPQDVRNVIFELRERGWTDCMICETLNSSRSDHYRPPPEGAVKWTASVLWAFLGEDGSFVADTWSGEDGRARKERYMRSHL